MTGFAPSFWVPPFVVVLCGCLQDYTQFAFAVKGKLFGFGFLSISILTAASRF